MFRVVTTNEFDDWIENLVDLKAKNKLLARIDRAKLGNLGDIRSVGGGISEMRIFYGPGYRIYFVKRKCEIVVLLIGGDKGSQSRDIKRAKELYEQLED